MSDLVSQACHTRHAGLALFWPAQRLLAVVRAGGNRTMTLNTRRNSADTTIPADTPLGWLPDANIAGQAIYDGNARRSGTHEWPRGLALPRHTGSAKGCHREGVLPQNGARGGQRRAATPCCSDAGSDGGVMARRATLDRGAESAAYSGGAEAPGSDGQRAERTGRHWRGAGGRWLVWAFRAVAWAVLLVIGYRGVTAIVNPPKQAGAVSGTAGAAPATGFPVRMAEAYAQQFAEVYLNFSPATAAARAQQLATFRPAGSDAQLGWDGSGTLQLQSAQVAGITVRDSQHAVVTLLVRASGHPVTLGRFLASGATVTGLGGTVTYGSISGIQVPPGGPSRHITVSVIWHLAGQAAARPPAKPPVTKATAGLEMTYRMTVVQQNGSWYVAAIGASTQPLAPP